MTRQKIFLSAFFLFIFSIAPIYSQISQGGVPTSILFNLDESHIPVIIPELGADQVQEKNTFIGTQRSGEALFAGLVVPLGLNLSGSGKWEVVNEKIHLWRQVIHVPEALGLGLNFDAFELSEGAKLFVYNPEKTVVLGAFDHNNNAENQIFSTQVIPGETLVIEYQEPYYQGKAERNESGLLRIESVIYLLQGGGLPVFGDSEKGLGDSGPCQVNINCPEGNNWQNHKRGVARMLMRVGNSYFWCSGSLVNNTAQDGVPFFLSAEHCGRNASPVDMMYWQFYFNYELPGCSPFGYPPLNLLVGADLISLGPLSGGSDFQLLKLRQAPPASWRPFFNGWDRSNSGSSSGTGIHHPRGDVKKISTYNTMTNSASPLVSSQQMAPNSAWRVVWIATVSGHGVVEGGSSGSPLFNSDGLIIGTLTGGSSSCSNLNNPDYYGKTWYHWDKNGPTPETQLAPHLDPLNTGQTALQGYDPHFEERPAPGFMSAKLTSSQQASLTWYKPGSAPNKEGWYNYVSNYSHYSWSGPERITVFEPADFGLSYPVTLSKISHTFVENQNHPWPNNQFRFRIYDSDGVTLIYLSPVLTAESLQVIEHELQAPLIFDKFFYVGIRPVDASGHPSSLSQKVNYGQGNSFYGSAGSWTVHNDGFSGSFSYLTSIFVQGNKSNEPIELNYSKAGATFETPENPDSTENQTAKLFSNAPQPEGYKVFRNGTLIHSTSSTGELIYNDNSPSQGLSYYYVTATYPGGDSDPSARAYLLNTEQCSVVINQFPYVQVFQNSFDDQCWLDFGAANWQLASSLQVNGTTINPGQGDQFFSMQTSNGSQADQWLILPELNLSSLSQPAMRFMFNGIRNAQEAVLNVWVSKNGESFRKVWDSNMHPGFASGNSNLQWLSTTLNIKEYGSQENIRLAFQYEGSGQGFFGIDKIEFLSAANITYFVNVSINPTFSGTTSGSGSYLSGQTVTLNANPNLGYVFNGWIQSSNLLSNDPEFSFIMPSGNVNLTASFISDPTSVPLTELNESTFEVFPNPARDYIRIRFNEGAPYASVKLFNAQAQLVASREPGSIQAGDEQRLNTSGLPQGIYFVQIRTNNLVRVLKVILTN